MVPFADQTRRRSNPKIARLSPSVPPLVNTISEARHPTSSATVLARTLHGGPRLLPVMMDRGRIAKMIRKIWLHRVQNRGKYWGCSVVV